MKTPPVPPPVPVNTIEVNVSAVDFHDAFKKVEKETAIRILKMRYAQYENDVQFYSDPFARQVARIFTLRLEFIVDAPFPS